MLARALAKDPERRYPTAEALAEDVEDILAGQPPRHAGGDDLVVVEESDSPLAELLVNATGASAPAAPPPEPAESSSVPPAAGATRSVLPADLPRRRPRWRAPALAAVAAGLGLLALFLWAPWRASAPRPPRRARPRPSLRPQPPPPRPSSARSPRSCRKRRAASEIDFDHPLRSGTLRVFVDDEMALEEPLTGQKRTKALVFGLHEGSSRNELEISPGLHEVRVEVRWDENVRTERIVGNFRSGATRRLEASLGRIRRDLDLEWK